MRTTLECPKCHQDERFYKIDSKTVYSQTVVDNKGTVIEHERTKMHDENGIPLYACPCGYSGTIMNFLI